MKKNKSTTKFAEVLKKLMEAKGVTAKTISKATGIPQSTLSEWSAGREPKLSEATLKIAQYFGVTLEYLITGETIEQKVFNDIFSGNNSDFITIHNGTYRVKIEKGYE